MSYFLTWCTQAHIEEGGAKLKELEEVQQALKDREVNNNPHTILSLEVCFSFVVHAVGLVMWLNAGLVMVRTFV